MEHRCRTVERRLQLLVPVSDLPPPPSRSFQGNVGSRYIWVNGLRLRGRLVISNTELQMIDGRGLFSPATYTRSEVRQVRFRRTPLGAWVSVALADGTKGRRRFGTYAPGPVEATLKEFAWPVKKGAFMR